MSFPPFILPRSTSFDCALNFLFTLKTHICTRYPACHVINQNMTLYQRSFSILGFGVVILLACLFHPSEDGSVLRAAGHGDPRRPCLLQEGPGPEEGHPSVCLQGLHVPHGHQRGPQDTQYPLRLFHTKDSSSTISLVIDPSTSIDACHSLRSR